LNQIQSLLKMFLVCFDLFHCWYFTHTKYWNFELIIWEYF
jgi:hypothetical protein